MNLTEQAAYEWLRKQGYADEQIIHRQRQSPDFLTADERGWEVKLARNKTVLLTSSQQDALREWDRVSFLVFTSPEDPRPVEIEASRVPDSLPAIVDGFRFTSAKQQGMMIRARITDQEWNALRRLAIDQHAPTPTVVGWAIRDLLERNGIRLEGSVKA